MSSARTSLRVSQRSKSPDAPAGEQNPGLRHLVQKRLLNDVFQAASDKSSGWKVLIVDDHAMRVISASVGMYDVMEKKVTIVESLDKKRAPFRDMGAIYLLEPTQDSVSKLIADYSSKERILYGESVFLYFTSRLPDQLLSQIKNCKHLVKRIKALVEVNIDFLAKEERAFSFDLRNVFPLFYLRKQATPVEVKIAEKLVTVCATLNEYPHIRYRQSSAICTSLASVFHLKMDEFVAQNPSWWYHGGTGRGQQGRERGTLLLLDRADDCLTPLLHDFHYQHMVHDLLKMDGDRITYQAETAEDPNKTEAKDVLLDEKDSLWVELRGKHIAAVIETLSNRIREITSSGTGSTLTSKTKGNMSLSQMAAALKALPEYREVMSKLSQHMHISHACMDVFRNEALLELGELEQTLATGKDEDGRTPKMSDMVDKIERTLMKMKNPMDRLRLILIATISQGGLRQQDRRRLMSAAELSRKDIRTLNSLEILGLSIFSSNDKNKLTSIFSGGRLSSTGNASDDEAEYMSSRYVAPLKEILEDLSQNALSLEDYPSVLPMPDAAPGVTSSASKNRGARSARASSVRTSAGSARKSTGPSSRWSKSSASDSRSSGPVNYSGGRNIIFMVGGLAYSELRVAREVMFKESREIVIGSTAFVSPEEFMHDLATLGQEED